MLSQGKIKNPENNYFAFPQVKTTKIILILIKHFNFNQKDTGEIVRFSINRCS